MSFSHDVKREICSNKVLRTHYEYALAYGILLFGKQYGLESICLHTEHRVVARMYGNLISDLSGLQGSITSREVVRSGRRSMFVVTVDGQEDRKAVLDRFGPGGQIRLENLPEDAQPAFLSGAFLACGVVSDPEKAYRAEFATPVSALRDGLCDMLSSRLSPPKTTTRRNDYVIYYKESEPIEDLLTSIGASNCSMRLMEVKIVKGLRNQVNRTTNCETANISKTVDAALEQIEGIQRIVDAGKLDTLDEDLRELALLRREHPEMSLRELGEAFSISRSSVNRKLRRILEISVKF